MLKVDNENTRAMSVNYGRCCSVFIVDFGKIFANVILVIIRRTVSVRF